MPAYSNATPPLSLFPGDVGFSFNAEAFPADGTAGAQFAVPEPAGIADQTHAVRWQTIFGSAPTAINIRLHSRSANCDRRSSAIFANQESDVDERNFAHR
jgi:hypothetical protein